MQRTTELKNQKIKDFGYDLVEIYECDLAKTPDFKKWFKTDPVEIVTSLDPRDAFFGGRTNVTKLTYDFKMGEKGKYVDFVSLYPTVQYFKSYPVGHPKKMYDPVTYDDKWFGFVKCRVEPPHGLYHPVFPVRMTCGKLEKLLFSLCKTCSKKQQVKCEHTTDERSFTGTWCTDELALAIRKGYKIHKIYEV